MGKSAHELAMRDPAQAALLGVMGDDFGDETSVFEDGSEFGVDHPDYGQDIGVEFGVEFGDDPFGADALVPVTTGNVAAVAAQHASTAEGRAIIASHLQAKAHTSRRSMLLEPNKGSSVKVERYTFALTATITALGTAGAVAGSNSPDVNFRPQRVTVNVVSPGMLLISDARIANVSFTGGQIDAWQFNANAVGQHLDLPTLTPANKASMSGSYTGLVPSPLSGTGEYTLVMSFSGPASIVA